MLGSEPKLPGASHGPWGKPPSTCPLLRVSLRWPLTLGEGPAPASGALCLILKYAAEKAVTRIRATTRLTGFYGHPFPIKRQSLLTIKIRKIGKISKTLKLQLPIVSPPRDNPIYMVLCVYTFFFPLYTWVIVYLDFISYFKKYYYVLKYSHASFHDSRILLVAILSVKFLLLDYFHYLF